MRLIGLQVFNNAVLGDVTLELHDENGNIFDTIIFAGENGCGKTTLLNIISDSGSRKSFNINEKRKLLFMLSDDEAAKIVKVSNYTQNKKPLILEYSYEWKSTDRIDFFTHIYCDIECKDTFPLSGYTINKIAYLTPEIQFSTRSAESVTSMELDTYDSNNVLMSTNNSANSIIQLIVDINNQDALDFAEKYNNNPSKNYSKKDVHPRIERFNQAFKYIVNDLSIDSIVNSNGRKNILFLNKGKKVPISQLSSGEKQLIFRGGFLLKDQNVLNGVIVLIDEPEISLHPDWQKRIVGFYRNILSDKHKRQTSQLFIATHSPFVIHNDDRINDKVFILKRENDRVVVLDKPEYYSYQSPSLVKDAFNVNYLKADDKTVFLEGRTDEKYFRKTIEVFGMDVECVYKWVGYIDNSGQERNTGYTALDHAFDFLVSNDDGNKYALFYDCDTRKCNCRSGNVLKLCADEFTSIKQMNKGIENALVLDNIDISPFYTTKTHNKANKHNGI